MGPRRSTRTCVPALSQHYKEERWTNQQHSVITQQRRPSSLPHITATLAGLSFRGGTMSVWSCGTRYLLPAVAQNSMATSALASRTRLVGRSDVARARPIRVRTRQGWKSPSSAIENLGLLLPTALTSLGSRRCGTPLRRGGPSGTP